ncbi:MAG: UvrB/UvrC motif-containing protein [Treponemataceae bacterium]|nr:UvrB/UvrC motif-containing protein [Treponemataceae bacterium]
MVKKCEICFKNPSSIVLNCKTPFGVESFCLCMKCALQRDCVVLEDKPTSEVNAIIASVRQEVKKSEKIACPECGTTLRQICAQHRTGCANCYKFFKKEIKSFTSRLNDPVEEELERLKYEMELAVQKEDYETAAVLRDNMKKILDNNDVSGENDEVV